MPVWRTGEVWRGVSYCSPRYDICTVTIQNVLVNNIFLNCANLVCV